MYRLACSLAFITATLAAAAPASADDGCSRDEYGAIHCLPGAYPGVPYYGPRYRHGYYGDYEDYGGRPYRRRHRHWHGCPPGFIGNGKICIRL